jgi:glutamate-1-semialdehyde aminotransferase
MNAVFPENGFLGKVRDLTHRHGALLVFDETITGFRYSLGGAQQEFGITPDLATFGKGIANGYPLSALVGRAEYMDVVERIFFSGTFGGETLSLAAAKAVLTKLQQRPVIDTLRVRGQKILDGVKRLCTEHELTQIISISGHPVWSFLQFKDAGEFTAWDIKTLFIQEVFKRGIYTLGTHNLSYAHSESDIETLLKCYQEVFRLIKSSIASGTLKSHLRCEPLVPLFQVR